MAGRGPTTFQKRQKEQQRKEKREQKLIRRQQRKQEGGESSGEPEPLGETVPEDQIDDGQPVA